MTLRATCLLPLAMVALLPAAVAAQSLMTRSMDVAQFGIPGDTTYLFCTPGQCPQRSVKHLYVPPPSRFDPPPLPAVAVSTIVPETAATLRPAIKPVKKRPQRPRRAPKVACKPTP